MTGQDPQARFNAIVAKAQAGNAEAQYALGMILTRQSLDQALAWMNKSAQGGYPQANFMLGIWYGEGTMISQQPEKAFQYITKAAQEGFDFAEYVRATAMAKGFGTEKDWKGAVSLMISLAQKGEGRALTQLAFLSAMAPGGAGAQENVALLKAAAKAGDAIAQYALGQKLLAGGDKEQGEAYIRLAAKMDRHVLAAEDPLVKTPAPEPAPKAFEVNLDWGKIAELLEIPPIPDLAPRSVLEKNPLVAVFPGFLSQEETDYIIANAAPVMKPSLVVDHINQRNIHRDYRTSSEMRFLIGSEDLVVHAINARISLVSEESLSHQEYLGVLRYEGGQEYKPHSDYFLPGLDGTNPEVERAGQRIKTFLVYLNEGYEGGETEFIKLGLKLKGRKGDGAMFVNVDSEGGPNRLTLHAGRPVTKGVKWLSTLWIRDRDYTPPPIGA